MVSDHWRGGVKDLMMMFVFLFPFPVHFSPPLLLLFVSTISRGLLLLLLLLLFSSSSPGNETLLLLLLCFSLLLLTFDGVDEGADLRVPEVLHRCLRPDYGDLDVLFALDDLEERTDSELHELVVRRRLGVVLLEELGDSLRAPADAVGLPLGPVARRVSLAKPRSPISVKPDDQRRKPVWPNSPFMCELF